MYKLKILSIGFLFVLSSICAQDIDAMTQKQKRVILHSDGTWEYWKQAKPFEIPVGDSHYLGAENAKITVIEWMDYQ